MASLSHALLRPVPLFFLFLTSTVLLYFPTLSFSFFQDDYVWLSLARDIPAQPGLLFARTISNFFMPMVHGYFALLFPLFGTHAGAYHALNIILHAVNAVLVFSLLKQLAKNPRTALAGTVFFLAARFPMEAVVWISAVTVLLTTLFLVLSGHAWLQFEHTGRRMYYALTIVALVLLMLTKEWTVLAFPFLLMLFFAQKKSQADIKKYALHLLPVLLGIAAYGIAQYATQTQESALFREGLHAIDWHAVPNMLQNMLLLFTPYTRAAYESGWWLSASVVFFVINIGVGIFLLKKGQRGYLLGFMWMIAAFAPTAFFTWDPFVSRYAYLPAIGVAMMIAAALAWIWEAQTPWLYKSALVVFVFFIAANALFLLRTQNQFYRPAYDENAHFLQALEAYHAQTPLTPPLAIVDNTPVKGFILPDVVHAFFAIPKKGVAVLAPGQTCPEHTACLVWHPQEKTITRL